MTCHQPDPGDHTTSTDGPGLSRGVVLLLAVTVGAAVANRYYVEPLLNLISHGFGASVTAAELLVVGAQFGYVVGLVLLVPLGDMLEPRRLVTLLLFGAAAAAVLCALAPSLPLLALALTGLSVLAVTAQILIPLAATLATEPQRGQVVGTVTSGLLVGVLAARALSGLAAGIGGFRATYAMAAVLMSVLAVLLCRALPAARPQQRGSYRALLASVLTLVRAEPVLRQRMALGFLQMAGFAVLWTPSAFLLAGPPYRYGTAVIGLFGLVGVAGALTAPWAGRLADRGHGQLAVTVALTVSLASWALLGLGRNWLPALIAGIALLDAGVQVGQVNHQTTIYALAPQARSRLNTAYMVAFFLGGLTGSLLAAVLYGSAGWYATTALGATLAVLALAVWAFTALRHTQHPAESEPTTDRTTSSNQYEETP